MSITERRRGIEPQPMAATASSASLEALPRLPLHHPTVAPVVLTTLAGSTTERAAEAAALLGELLALRAAQTVAGPASAAKKAATYAAKLDVALAEALRSMKRDGPTNTLPRTAEVILKRLRNSGLQTFGLAQMPSKEAIRAALKRRVQGTLSSLGSECSEPLRTAGLIGNDASSSST